MKIKIRNIKYPAAVLMLAADLIFTGCTGVSPSPVTGLDVLEQRNFSDLAGKKVGLVSNHTGLDAAGRHAADLMHEAEDVQLYAIFAPEHGFRGNAEAGAHIEDGRDAGTGAVIYSIYGATRKPSPEMLEGLDVLVFDMQDVGARFYTYISTMGYCMEAAAEAGIPFVVLDRPNPIGGRMDGPLLNMEHRSFIGMYPIPIQHGMTVGELAMMIKGENWMDGDLSSLDLTVIPCENYSKTELYKDWPPPSPNIPDLETALVYPGTCLFEAVNISEGRGTDRPFLTLGAPWLDNTSLADRLNKLCLPGVHVDTLSFSARDIPGKAVDPKYEGERSRGIRITVTDPEIFEAIPLALNTLFISHDLHPELFQWRNDRVDMLLWGSAALRDHVAADKDPTKLMNSYQDELASFRQLSEKYVIYK